MYRLIACFTVFTGLFFISCGQSEKDFVSKQNPQGGIIITGYNGSKKDVIIPAKIGGVPVIRIEEGAFRSRGLTSVKIPNSVITIGREALAGNKLTDIVIPDSVTFVDFGALAYNKELKSVTLSNRITGIDYSNFVENPITSITLGANVDFWEQAGIFILGSIYIEPFEDYYNSQNKKAGTYVINDGGLWTIK
jgi:hypothetical protein